MIDNSPLNPTRLEELQKVYRDGLLDDTLPFWLNHAIDREHGGYTAALGRKGNVLDTDKGIWIQGRFAWMLGELYNNVEKRQEWLELANHGIQFLEKHGFDPEDGRMWFHVTQKGEPLRKRRYAFSESFAAIAYGELAKATQNDEFKTKAEKLFNNFISHNLNPKGVQPKFTDTRPTRGIGFPMITINTAQELRESIQLEVADEWIDKSIETIEKFHLKPDLKCVMETVGEKGEIINHFDGRTLNPGHAIEGAWFILNEGKYRQDSQLIKMGCEMLDWMWDRGWDREYGGILYFVDLNGGPVQEYWHDMKFWWPHNETIIATLLAYSLTQDEKYAQWHRDVHDWSYQHFHDREHGEWYGYLHRDGRISVDLKGNLWKGPFHYPRMQLVCWKLVEELLTQKMD